MTSWRTIIALTIKDLRLVLRDRVAFFFTFFFPLLFALLFGFIFSGSGGGVAGVRIAVVDEAKSDASARFIEHVREHEALTLVVPEGDASDAWDRDAAFSLVRKGGANAAIVLEPGFADAESLMLEGEPMRLTGVIDPSRRFATGVIQGVLSELLFRELGETFADPDAARRTMDRVRQTLPESDLNQIERAILERFMNSAVEMLDAAEASENDETSGDAADGEQAIGFDGIIDIALDEVSVQRGPNPSAFELTFAQGAAWGLMGCVMGFGLSIVRERSAGTLVRLRLAPISGVHILGAKAIACFLTAIAMMMFLVIVAHLPPMNVRAASYPLLAMAIGSSAFGFVGVMSALGSLGRTEGSIDGLARAVLLLLALFGGAGVPLEFMPEWMVGAAGLSPFRWMIESMDGALWRGYSFAEMLRPCLVLLGFGVVGLGVGLWGFARGNARSD